MRYEQLTYSEKINTLKRLHRYINKHLFDNSLKTIALDIENLSKEAELYGMFSVKDYPEPQSEKISISYEFEEDIKKFKTQKEQALFLGMIVLHEVIHQYCYENGINDKDHSGKWTEIAENHGLTSIYENGKQVRECLNMLGMIAMQNFRIK